MNSIINKLTSIRRVASRPSFGRLAILSLVFLAAAVQAQEDMRLRFSRPAPLRFTVSVNTTNVGVFTNRVSLSSNIFNTITLSVSNVPAGCGYDLTAIETNGSVIASGLSVSITNSAALNLTLRTTNVALGEYTFYLQGVGIDATNSLPLMLQSCYIWQGTNDAAAQFNATYSWTNNTSWVGGNNPGLSSANDVFFGDLGAQTNRMANNLSFTNIQIDQDIAVGSLRFGAGTYENTNSGFGATNALFHHVRINNSKALTVTGTKGFSLLRDYIAEYGNSAGSHPDRKTGLMFSGGNGARVVVSNTAANFAILLDGGANTGDSFLAMTNIGLFQALVNRMGLGEFQLYPNYRGLNMDTNGLGAVPRLFVNSVYFARTNFITAYYTNADNYTNDNTRAYAISWLNGETSGNGSGVNNQLWLGLTNRFLADSMCLVGANHASGNGGFVRFNTSFDANGFAVFRNTNGTGRMSIFTVADGGGTNDAGSNIKANIDFAGLVVNGTVRNAIVDMLADRFYIARDRSMIAESNTVNYQGSVTFGRGVVDLNTVILGYQEHQVKLNNATPQLGYCQGNLTITNGGLFKVNNQLTLGYTADTNDLAVAQQYNTYGRFSIYNSTGIVNRIVVDGGPYNYSHLQDVSHPRQDFISLLGAYMVVSNTIGNAPGQPLNSFTSERSTNVWFVGLGRTNLICRSLSTPGTAASVIKVAGISGVTSMPTTIPIISYEGTASPYLQADVSSSNPGTNGYLLNNISGNSVDLYLTTNQPLTLRWTGSVDTNWDYTTKNWMPVGGVATTNFHIGDIALFDDTSTVTNVWVVGEVVPGQTGAGVTVSNNTRAYSIDGGTVAGTSLLLKTGTGTLLVSATKQGPANLDNGTMQIQSSGTIGTTTVSSNGVVNCFGTINGGLTSTNVVVIGAGGFCAGAVSLQGGYLANSGLMATSPGGLTVNNTLITNTASGTMSVAGGQWTLPINSVLANFGTVTNVTGRINISGLVFGDGTFVDPDGGFNGGTLANPGVDGRVAILGPNGLLSPGATPGGSIGTVTVKTRFDVFTGNNNDNNGFGTYLCEVDKTNAQTSDLVAAEFWNQVNGKIVMKNLNPGVPFANGDNFQIFTNISGNPLNIPDTDNLYPTVVEPYIPGPGLLWNLNNYIQYGQMGVTNTLMKWVGGGNSIWDTNTANWLPGNYADGQGVLFDDTATSKTVALTNIIVFPVGSFRTTNFDLTVYTTNGSTITTNYNWSTNLPSIAPGIVISNTSDYTITGPGQIAGWCSLYKTGPGTLTFGNMSNVYNGTTIIDEGTVVVPMFTNNGTGSPLGAPGAAIRAPRVAERLLLGNATLRFTGNTMSSDRGFTVTSTNSTFDISNSTTTLAMSGPVLGFGQLNKVGAGTLTLQSSGTTVTNIIVKNGTLRLAPSTAGQAPAGSGHLILAGGALSFSNNVPITNLVNLVSNTVIDNTNTTILGGSWIGSGNATITNLPASILAWNRDMTNYSGDLTLLGGGTFRLGNSTNETRARGSAYTVFNLAGAGTRLDTFNGGDTNGPVTYELGGLVGVANTILAGRASNNPAILQTATIFSIGGKAGTYVYSGTITNGSDAGSTAPVSVVKVGTGTQTFAGASTYSGGTIVSNGTLLANGVASTGTNTVTVAGGTLGGTGSISGAVTVGAAGTLSPGTSPGTLTVSNSVTLNGTALMELTPATSDLLRVTGTLTGGGTLTVTNIGGTLTNGTVFTLFSQPVTGFTSTNLPAGYGWTVNLGGAGTIAVASGGVVPLTPTSIANTVSGSTLTLSWPSDHIGWTLQTQTNALSVGLTAATNNWFGVAGSSATNSVSLTIDPTQPTVFYRLVYP